MPDCQADAATTKRLEAERHGLGLSALHDADAVTETSTDAVRGRGWSRPLHRLVEAVGRPNASSATGPASRGQQLVKIGQLVRRFKSEWRITKSRRLHCEGKEYSVDLVMVHPDHGVALVSVCPSAYALPDLAIDIVRDILVKGGLSDGDAAVLPIVFVSAHERSMQDVAADLQVAFSNVAAPSAQGWEKRVYKILSAAKYDRMADDLGAEIINPSSAAAGRRPEGQRALPMLPAPVILYFACSGVGVVAGIAATIVVLLH